MNDMISRTTFRNNIQTVLNDITCPIHIAAEIEQYLELEPAVDAAPVAHGRWYDKGSLSCRCSCCGCKSNKEYNYCPNCGAKMDDEQRNNK